MTISVLGLAGSPRKRGNTAILLDQALEGAAAAGAQVTRVELARLRIAPCIACDGCYREGVCIVQDEFQEVFPNLLAADAIAFASPLYFLGVTGWAKAFIDRCQCLWARKYILHQPMPPATDGRPRRGILLSVGGMANPNFDGARATVRIWLRTLDAVYLGDVVRPHIDETGTIRAHPDALQEAYRLGQALVNPPAEASHGQPA